MAVVFKDEHIRSQYQKYGFAVVDNFLNADEVDTLLRAVSDHGKALEGVSAFSTSTDNRDTNFRVAMREVINGVVHTGKTNPYFEGYNPFYSNLLIKKPDNRSEMVLHTDWSITDESRFTPLQIWIPLTDVNRQNGTLAVVPGSHHLTHVYRGCRVEEPYLKFERQLLEKHLYYLEIRRGTAVFYHPGILHYSPSNLSEQTRLAVLVSYYPSEMAPVLYYKHRVSLPGAVSVYALTIDFFNTWDKQSRPYALKRIKTVRQVKGRYDEKEFLSNLEQYRYA